MFEIKANTASCIFENQFQEIHHQCSIRFSKNSFVESSLVFSQKKIYCSARGPRFCNKPLDQQEKSLEHNNHPILHSFLTFSVTFNIVT